MLSIGKTNALLPLALLVSMANASGKVVYQGSVTFEAQLNTNSGGKVRVSGRMGRWATDYATPSIGEQKR